MLEKLRKPASWLVAVCERGENRGCGGGGCRKGTKSRRAPVLSARKRSILLDYVPLGNLLTVGVSIPPRSAFLVAGETMRMYWKI